MTTIHCRVIAIALLTVSTLVPPAAAQPSSTEAAPSSSKGSALAYPAKAVRVIVPFTPGGAIDLIGRMVGQRLSERLNTPFIIENRPGGGTNIGAEVAARSAPDGYTLFMASTSQAVNVTLYP